MIRFHLRCSADHGFESWFASGAAYDRMAAGGLVECPVCGDTAVGKALMAPAVARTPGVKGRAEAAPATRSAPPPTTDPPAAETPLPARAASGPMPAQLVALLQRMRAEVEQNCDYVGSDFAEEARRIHDGEAEARGIYGEASDTEAEALREDGIEVARIPWLPKAD
jgi:hypothetical protein